MRILFSLVIEGLASAAFWKALYKQCDGRYANDVISRRTIFAVGCLMSSVSMALTDMGKTCGSKILCNPKNLN